mmetsp:Transcript_16312/g.25452  ORF Transcript_16312/g.25452 Transcript_16312/m.25452 type:complete len:208 (-) Transcript_16312:4493-5116(-)
MPIKSPISSKKLPIGNDFNESQRKQIGKHMNEPLRSEITWWFRRARIIPSEVVESRLRVNERRKKSESEDDKQNWKRKWIQKSSRNDDAYANKRSGRRKNVENANVRKKSLSQDGTKSLTKPPQLKPINGLSISLSKVPYLKNWPKDTDIMMQKRRMKRRNAKRNGHLRHLLVEEARQSRQTMNCRTRVRKIMCSSPSSQSALNLEL